MISIFILSVLGILMAGMACYAVYSSVKSTEMLTLVGRNATEMDGIVSVLRANIRKISTPAGDQLFLPIPDVNSGPTLSFLPGWLLPNARTPWGSAYGYCAYAPAAIVGPLSTTAAGASLPYDSGAGAFSMADLTAPDGTAREYLVGGPNPYDATVLGFVISPAANSDVIPSCDAVQMSGGVYRVTGATPGTAVAIVDDAAVRAGLPTPPVMIRYVAPAGVGDGVSKANPETLTNALAEWKSVRPPDAVMILASGNHTVSGTDLNLASGGFRLNGRSIKFAGAGAGTTTISKSGSAAVALTSDADVTLDGLTLGAGVALWPKPGSRMQAFNSALRYVYVDGADFLVGAGTSIAAVAADVPASPGTGTIGDAAVAVQTGRVTFASGTTPTITWNGNPSPVQPRVVADGALSVVQTACTSSPCAASCATPPTAAPLPQRLPLYVIGGACSAGSVTGGEVMVAESGMLPNAVATALPTDWNCRFSTVSTTADPTPPAVTGATGNTARAICSPTPAVQQ